ncbi:DNA repair protein rad52 [Malassezia yamatoensis]|uniref:DNA repair protein rad52 n=1 Tax=Malassezia yamatoensis TaxID=253288 RepID=A0AAJ5YRV8_9BASI|nr:DNA repair protein rad52 [Malassezia yamatoensis]
MSDATRETFVAPTSHDAFPVGFGGTAFSNEIDSETGLPLWTAKRLATLQCKLNQRLGPEYLSQRQGPGGGPKLTYIEGWKAVDLANEVFGFNGWSTSITSLDVDYLDIHPESGRCNCGVSAIVRITLRDGTYHEDVGYGHTEGARGKHAALEKLHRHTDKLDLVNSSNPSRPDISTATHASDQKKRSVDFPESDRAAVDARQARLKSAAAARAKLAERRYISEDPAHDRTKAAPRTERIESTTASTKASSPSSKSLPSAKPEKSDAPKPHTPPEARTNISFDDAEADSMALELELEDELLLRQSQLAQELDEDHLLDTTDTI